MASPTARTLELLRAQGWVCDPVERRNSYIARDYLGIIDIIALKQGVVLGVQATTDHDAPRRIEKATGERAELLKRWLEEGGQFAVWGWTEKQERMVGSKRTKTVGVLRIREVRLVAGKLVADEIERKKPERKLFR